MALPSERRRPRPARLDSSAAPEEWGLSLHGAHRAAVRLRHLSRSTEKAYAAWIRRYLRFHRNRHPLAMGKTEVELFLSHLALEG